MVWYTLFGGDMKVGDLVKHRAEYKLTGTIVDVVDMDDAGMLYKVFWLNN